MPRQQTHPHKLKQVNTAKKEGKPFYVYKCTKCRFFSQKNLCVGVDAECWRCHKEFRMTDFNLRQARPRCAPCTGKVIPLTEMPPPKVDLVELKRKETVMPVEEKEKITEEIADQLVDKFLNLNILGKVKR